MIDITKATEALRDGLAQYGLQPDVEIVNVKHGHVLVLGFSQAKDKPDVGNALIKLERWMKAHMNVKDLELQCESLDDRNRRDIKHGRKVAPTVSARNVEALE